MKLKMLSLLSAVWMLSACTGHEIPQDATTPSKAATVSLEMDKQRTQRFCNGRLVSDQVEVVKDPTELMSLFPLRNSSVSYSVSGSSFVDIQTSSSPMVVDNTHFWVDHGNGALGMHVLSGVNEIQYRFSFSDGYVETGSRYIDVSYTENVLSGTRTVQEDPGTCNQQYPPPASPSN